MGDVIEMNSHRKPGSIGSDRAVAEARRAGGLRSALSTKARFAGDDPKRAATNLHALLEEFKSGRGLRKRDVAIESGLCDRDGLDSTKRLDPYTCPEHARDKRIARLARKPRMYFKIADAIAKLTGDPMNALLCRIFEGCSFGTSAAKGADWEDQRWEGLANLIQAMSRRIILDTNLAAYWRDALMLQGEFDVRSMALKQAHSSFGNGGAAKGLAGVVQCSDEIAPVPSIPIARRLQAPKSKGLLALNGNDPEQVDFIMFLEIRLALAPLNAATNLGPLLEFRSVLEAISPVHGYIRFDNPFTDGNDQVREAITDVGRFPVELVEWPETPDAERRDGCEHSFLLGKKSVRPCCARC